MVQGAGPGEPTWEVRQGDAMQLVRALPSNSVHLSVTSVPYFWLRHYLEEGHEDKGLEIGWESGVEEWAERLADLYEEILRVTHPSGLAFVNCGDKVLDKEVLGAPWRMAFAIQRRGWKLKSDVVWHKPNGIPEPDRGRPALTHEYIFQFGKSRDSFWDHDGGRIQTGGEASWGAYADALGSNKGADAARFGEGYRKRSTPITHPLGSGLRSVWKIPTNRKSRSKIHYADYPDEIPRRCIAAGSSEGGCCSECLEPLRRVVELGEANLEAQKACGGDSRGEYRGNAQRQGTKGKEDPSEVKRRILNSLRERHTVRWDKRCDCRDAGVKPCLVLDPFSGSGTTGIVAVRLGRSYLGFELNEHYAADSRGFLAEELEARGKLPPVKGEVPGQLDLFGV